MKKRMKFLLILSVGAILIRLLTVPAGAQEEVHSETEQSIIPSAPSKNGLDVGKTAPDFSLIDQDKKPISLSDYAGRPRFVVFIYTHCKDVCPLILQNRKRLEKDLETIIGKGVVFLGVTFDPKEDTPEVLKDFIKKIGVSTKDLHLLTGSEEVINKVLRDYEINVFRDAKTGRAVSHSAIGYAVDKDGIIREFFNFSPG